MNWNILRDHRTRAVVVRGKWKAIFGLFIGRAKKSKRFDLRVRTRRLLTHFPPLFEIELGMTSSRLSRFFLTRFEMSERERKLNWGNFSLLLTGLTQQSVRKMKSNFAMMNLNSGQVFVRSDHEWLDNLMENCYHMWRVSSGMCVSALRISGRRESVWVSHRPIEAKLSPKCSLRSVWPMTAYLSASFMLSMPPSRAVPIMAQRWEAKRREMIPMKRTSRRIDAIQACGWELFELFRGSWHTKPLCVCLRSGAF